MAADAYDKWDRSAAAERALQHADTSSSRDAGGCIWNFAFGSNMSASKVLSRGLKPVRSLPARLCGWQLLFNHRGGYANIETLAHIRERNIDTSHLPQPLPDSTLGVLLLLSQDDFAELARQEYAYNTVEVAAEVIAPSGSSYIIHALAFKTDPCAVAPAQTLPSQRYMTIIRQGARQSGLDAAYCCWIDRIPTAILRN